MSNLYMRFTLNEEKLSATGGWDVRNRFEIMKEDIKNGKSFGWGFRGSDADTYMVELVRRRKNKTKKLIDKIEFSGSGELLRST
ncbi:hypothetical protein [Paenibacillus sp. FSL H3-0333]|uniref:hypothetical protein n=1 Tax=Paenibacillus sp. FSL H3-0333 TaxID=2921373 RepID=UPI0030F887D4